MIKRPGYGISPIYWDEIIANRAKAKTDIREDEIILWDHISF